MILILAYVMINGIQKKVIVKQQKCFHARGESSAAREGYIDPMSFIFKVNEAWK